MADTTHPITADSGVTRRDFLVVATGAFAAVGAAATLWPFIDQMNPDAAALALASTEVDTTSIEQGQSVIAVWQGKPVAVRYRTEEEMKAAQEVPLSELKDPIARNANLDSSAPATDANRTRPGQEQWLVMVQVCTHLGCVPLGQQGEYGGWFCPCHGSQYDTAGRIRSGPAPENMAIPPYTFTSETSLRIG